jgi:hypothetical protein
MRQDTTNLPPPPVAANVDLRRLPRMMLDVQRLLDCDRQTECSPESNWVALTLWCKAWHLVPAGSLPNDDVKLSAFGGYGRAVGEWLKVKEQALRGFTLCADGRLYHSYLSVVVNEAWVDHLKHLYKRLSDRLSKAHRRVPSFQEWSAVGNPNDWPFDSTPSPPGPPQNSAKRKTEKSARKSMDSLRNSEDSAGKTENSGGIRIENALKVRKSKVNKDSLSHTPEEREAEQLKDEEFNTAHHQLIQAGWQGRREQARAIFEDYSKCPPGSLEEALKSAQKKCDSWPKCTSWLLVNSGRIKESHPGRKGEASLNADAQAQQARIRAGEQSRRSLACLAHAVLAMPAERLVKLKTDFESADPVLKKVIAKRGWQPDNPALWTSVSAWLQRTDPPLLAELVSEEPVGKVVPLRPPLAPVDESVDQECLDRLARLVAGG